MSSYLFKDLIKSLIFNLSLFFFLKAQYWFFCSLVKLDQRVDDSLFQALASSFSRSKDLCRKVFAANVASARAYIRVLVSL